MKKIIEWIEEHDGAQVMLATAVLAIIIVPLAIIAIGFALKVVGPLP